jgi:Zn-dependent protease/predicted transcriptional regulator
MRSYTVGRIWDIPIRLNVSLIVFLPVLVWLIGSGQQIETYVGFIDGLTGVEIPLAPLRANATPWLIGTLAAVGLFVSVMLHELGHSWVALRYDINIESISLWILGGIAALESIPEEWNREFWIAIAGPIVSVLTAAGCWVMLLVLPNSLPVLRFVFGWLIVTNIILTVFNLLPAFPMDGGRILRALLARSRPYGSATRLAARVGVMFAILFGVVGVLSFSPLLVLLALFVYGAATTESRMVLLEELLAGLTVNDIMTRDTQSVAADASIDELIDRALRDRTSAFPVVENGTTVGVVTMNDLKDVRPEDRTETTVRTVMREVPIVAPESDAFETLTQLSGSGALLALVTDETGIVGVLSEADYGHAMQIQKGFRSGP